MHSPFIEESSEVHNESSSNKVVSGQLNQLVHYLRTANDEEFTTANNGAFITANKEENITKNMQINTKKFIRDCFIDVGKLTESFESAKFTIPAIIFHFLILHQMQLWKRIVLIMM